MRRLLQLLAVLLLAVAAAAQEESPDDLGLLEELRADFVRGGTWAAQRDLAEYLQDFPASPQGRRLAAEVALQRGQVAAAEEHLRAGGWPDGELQGRVLLRAGRYEEALALARGGTLRGLAADWLAVAALDGLGQRVEARRAAAERAAAVDDRTLDGRGLLDLGRLLLFARRHELANQAFVFADAALNGKQGPGYRLVEPEAPLLLARVRIETRQGGVEGPDPLLRLLQQVLTLDAGLPEALVLKARLHLDTLNGRAAEEALQAALRRDPGAPEALLLLGRTRLLDRRPDAALELAERALEGNPRLADALALRAAALEVAGRDGAAEARAAFEAAQPESSALDLLLGEVLQGHYRFAESVVPLERALSREPDDERPLPVLAQSLAHLGREAEARAALEEHERRSPFVYPWRSNMLEVLGWLAQATEVVTPGDRNFRLRLPAGEQDVLGVLLPARLEAARADMAERWGIDPPWEVLVEVFDVHADFSVRTVGFEGFLALGACFGRVMTMLSPLCELRGRFHWAQTAVHEYAHVVTLALSGQRVPRWLTEGVSVVEEKLADPAWARSLERDVLDARANGLLLPVDRLDEAFRDGETVMLGYYQGSLLCEVVLRDFGFGKLRDLVASFADGRDTAAAVRAALGIEPAELDRRLLAYVDGELAARAVVRPRRNAQGEALARARAVAGEADAWLDVAHACFDLGRRADAEDALSRYLQARGETPAALAALARRDLADGQPGPAREKLERWAAGSEPDADGLSLLAGLQESDGDLELARATLRRASDLYPGDVGEGSASARLLALLAEAAEADERFALLERLVAHDETALLPRLELARRALEQGESEKALALFAAAAEIDPYRGDVRLELADALVAAGRQQDARAQWRLVLGLRAGQLPGGPAQQGALEAWQTRAREALGEQAAPREEGAAEPPAEPSSGEP
jgi:Tfp pilus assembly protein PilF